MKRGFSLVELSIVLVILGLLTGGILAGQSLIRASEMRSVITEFQQNVSAIQSFRDKYMGLPGDLRNATRFWGTMTNCGVASPSGSGTQTCDGNGDGNIESASAASRTGEMFAFWVQLANAGLISGTYTGIAGSGAANQYVSGQNMPNAKLANAGWGVRTLTANEDSTTQFTIGPSTQLKIGAASSNSMNNGAVMSVDEAWNIDIKLDDGRPAVGRVIAVRYAACTTATNSTMLDADYKFSASGIQCALGFVNPF